MRLLPTDAVSQMLSEALGVTTYHVADLVTLLHGDVTETLRQMPEQSVHAVITSPPYWSLRDYKVPGQIGLEPTIDEYVAKLVAVFAEVKRVLRDDGIMLINLGDSYWHGDARHGVGSGNDGKELPDLSAYDDASRNLCGECVKIVGSHNLGSDGHLGQESRTSAFESSRSHRGQQTAHSKSLHSTSLDAQIEDASLGQQPSQVLAGEPLPASQESMLGVSSRQPLGECLHCANCDACLAVLRLRLPATQVCARKMVSPFGPGSSLPGATGQPQSIEYKGGSDDAYTARNGDMDDGFGDSIPSYLHSTTIDHHIQLKPLDLCNIPHRVAQALQADGWYWRDTWHWIKRSPMPESVSGTGWERHRIKLASAPKDSPKYNNRNRDAVGYMATDGSQPEAAWQSCPGCTACTYPDRPQRNGWVLRRGSWRYTSAVEYVFMFAKQPGYTAFQEQVRTPNSDVTLARVKRGLHNDPEGQWAVNVQTERMGERFAPGGGANPRNYGLLSSEPSSEPHYATFPQGLVEPFIRAATSDRGVCAACGAQFVPAVERSQAYQEMVDSAHNTAWFSNKDRDIKNGNPNPDAIPETNILDYWPSCEHQGSPVPATVLDIFVGSGTTCIAARRLGRRSIGIDLSVDYLAIARRRLADEKNAQAEMMLLLRHGEPRDV